MNDFPVDLFRGFMTAFVPGMLLFPLIFVLAVPTKVEEQVELETARSRQIVLAIFTLLAIGVWAGLTLIARQTGSILFDQFSRQSWLLFFPLWFGIGMKALQAKNPAWVGTCQPLEMHNSQVRTASLKPRNRENPIRTWHWVLMAVASLVPLIVLASRGAFSFGPDGPAASTARFRWALVTGVYGFCSLITLPIVPISVRKSLVEPEPLDPSGSPELEAMYRSERRKRILSLFWLLGVAQPLMIGTIMNATVWGTPASGRTLGMIGAIGGTTIGLAGGVIGTIATIRRVRIAEERARLEAASKVR